MDQLERGKGSVSDAGFRNPGKKFSVNEREAMPLRGPRAEPNTLPDWAQGGAPGSSGAVDALPSHARGGAPLPMNQPDNLPEYARGKEPLPLNHPSHRPYANLAGKDEWDACEGGPDARHYNALARSNKGQGGAPSPGPSGPSFAGDGY